ncbi:hypothetical protein Fot_06393 [Forsythia ovata]|uniref:Uncharacterized protein n=1 Tax=Forsythia ovata TaxID=205694 RepID=A0ABD1WSX4_9LAMI
MILIIVWVKTIICYSRKESIVSNETNDSDRLENPPSEELRSVYSDSEEEFVQFPEFNPKKEMLHPELEVENKFRSKEEFKAEGNRGVEGLLSDGTIAPSQASTMGHGNQDF